MGLVEIEHHRAVVRRRDTALLARHRFGQSALRSHENAPMPRAATTANVTTMTTATLAVFDAKPPSVLVQVGVQLDAGAFSAPDLDRSGHRVADERGPLSPDMVSALTTLPPGTVTLVAAVTYRPASTTQSSPSAMPMPAFAPSRQRSPIEITCWPPPDSVPMIDAPPPMSESQPTTTPDEIRARPSKCQECRR